MNGAGFNSVSKDIYGSRLKVVTFIILATFATLVLRLWIVQIVNGPAYRVQSENNRIRLTDVPPFRGMMFDRNGELIVDNRPSFDLFVVPEEVHDPEKLSSSFEELIGLAASTVEEKLNEEGRKAPFRPLLVKKNLTRKELAVIETNLFNLPGTMIQVKPQRHYIYSQFASHVIGYLGEINENQLNSGEYPDSKPGDLIGKYGVERKWQNDLNGLRGEEQVEVDAVGRRLKVISRKPPASGYDIGLTIDENLQFVAEEQLKNKKGAIVAVDPRTGEILAMASSPSFDPNMFLQGIDKSQWSNLMSSKDHPLQNRAIAGQYPPGSTFKIVMALAGLEEGVIDPNEEIFCNGSFTVGNHTYHCWRKQGHGRVNLHRALVESCDVYFYNVGKRLGVDRIAQYAKMCGLGSATDFELGFEKDGLIPTSQWKLQRFGIPWQPGETISTAIGQGYILVTPLQMARLMSALFNGGYLYQPSVIKWVGEENRKIYRFSPKVLGRLHAKEQNLALIRDALIGVVNEPHGTGSSARLKTFTVAGKTGTAQVVELGREKAVSKEAASEFGDHAWFLGIAPTENPALAVAILVENGGHGGSAAAPIAKKMFEAYLGKVQQSELLAKGERP
jgi:penicillin-binding protein 2